MLSGSNLLAYNAETDTPAGFNKVLTLEQHRKMDYRNLAMLGLLSFYKPIRTNKKALAFHLAFLSLAAANVVLTDWNSDRLRLPEVSEELKEALEEGTVY